MLISIHSLVKRETPPKTQNGKRYQDFNPLPRKEGDDRLSYHPFDGKNHFNPLPRKEGDGSAGTCKASRGDFNPLPRKEGDCNLMIGNCFRTISIHSLVKRETTKMAFSRKTTPLFQSTPS